MSVGVLSGVLLEGKGKWTIDTSVTNRKRVKQDGFSAGVPKYLAVPRRHIGPASTKAT